MAEIKEKKKSLVTLIKKELAHLGKNYHVVGLTHGPQLDF